jgi:2'-5' RNA ligase
LADTIRAFVATHLPEEPLAEVLACIARLKEELADLPIKWVKPEQIHITLDFLGPVETDPLPKLILALEKAAEPNEYMPILLEPFDLRLGEVGHFRTAGHGQILWLGLEGDLYHLGEFSYRVGIASMGFSTHRERRKYSPHITIARCPKISKDDFNQIQIAMNGIPLRPLSWTVDSFQLMRSHPKPTGAEYEILQSFVLTK